MSATFWYTLVVFLLADAIILPPMITRARRRPMDEVARASAPGQFTRLTDGITHYQWHGPAAGPVIVLVHGLSASSFVFAGLIPFLTGAGYRVLTYDLFGRGWSDRPANAQTAAFFTRQLDEMLTSQKIGAPVTILGYSMGGAVVSAFAFAHPSRVANLILLAPADFGLTLTPRTRFLVNTPLIGDWLMTVFGAATLRALATAEDMSQNAIPDIADKMIWETEHRGYLRAILSSLRNVLHEPQDDLHLALATQNIATLAIWGGDDATIPIGNAARLSAANPAVTTEIIARADHALAYVMPDQVAEKILDFLPHKDG